MFINVDKEELILRENGIETHFSLQEINKKLILQYNKSTTMGLKSDELTFTLTENNRSIKLVLQAYATKNPDFTGKDTQEYANISGYALVK